MRQRKHARMRAVVDVDPANPNNRGDSHPSMIYGLGRKFQSRGEPRQCDDN